MRRTCLLLTQSGHTLSSFDTVRYPVEIGLVPSLNQPGGNVTGMAIFDAILCTKRLEFVPMTGATSVVEFELVNAD